MVDDGITEPLRGPASFDGSNSPETRDDEPRTDNLEGARLGEFRIVRLIGRGGMASVYEATQESMQRTVALKVLSTPGLEGEQERQRFAREAWIGGRLVHPNIVPVYAKGVDRGFDYIAMEYVDGRSLHAELEEERGRHERAAGARGSAGTVGSPGSAGPAGSTGSVKPTGPAKPASSTGFVSPDARTRRIVSLLAGVADALDFVHRQGIVHRDVKPLNLLLPKDGSRLLLSDFGLARDTASTRMTRAGDFLGTIHYMSPEQLLAQRVHVDRRTDIYSLGVTLYEALTLDLPYDAATEEAYISAVSTKEPIAPRARSRSIPRDLETIVMKCLERDRDRRYGSAGELRDDLRRWLEGQPVKARRPSLADHALRFARRHRIPVAAALATAVVVIGAVLIWTNARRASSDLRRARAVLAQTIETGRTPASLDPQWPALEKRVRKAVRKDPDGPLGRLLTRASVGFRMELPAFGLIADPPGLGLNFMTPVEAGRDFLGLMEVDGSWDGSPWRTLETCTFRHAAQTLATDVRGGVERLDRVVGRLQPGPHRLELRPRLTLFGSTRDSIAWLALDPNGRADIINWQVGVAPSRPLARALVADTLAITSLAVTLFDEYPAAFPHALNDDASMAALKSWLRPDRIRITRFRLAGRTGDSFSFTLGECELPGRVPYGLDPRTGFPAGIEAVFRVGEAIYPPVPIAAAALLSLERQERPLAGFDLAYGRPHEMSLGKGLGSCSNWVSGSDRRLVSSAQAIVALEPREGGPWCQPDIPADGVYPGVLRVTPSREIALRTGQFDRYFGRELTLPVQVEIVTREIER